MPNVGEERVSGGVNQIYTNDGVWETKGYAPPNKNGPSATGFGKIPEQLAQTRTPKDSLSFSDLEKFQTAITAIGTSTTSIQDNMGVILDMLALEDTLRVDISKSIGMSNEQLFDTINELNEAGESASRFALTVNDLFTTFKEITLEVGRKLRISPEVTERAALLTKTLEGFDASDFAKGFDDIGFSLDKAIGGVDESNNAMSEILETGRGFGVVMEKFLGNVTSQLKLVNTYGFDRGVEGLARMVARSQTLGLEMSTVTSLADKFLDPEGAIDFAARMQVIGGAVGDLQDPFKLMYMATNDLEGLQEAIIDTAAAAVTFDEDKGKFVISPEQRRQLKDMAEAMGTSYQDLADTAVKSARRAEAFSEMKFLDNVTETDKELIAGMAQMGEGGEMQVRIPSLDKMVDLDSLTAEEIGELKTVGMTDSQVYAQQLTVAEKANQYLATIDTGVRKMIRAGGGDTEGMLAASLSQQLGESMELLTTEQLNLIGEGDMAGFMKNFSDPANAPTGLTPEGTNKILQGLKNMGLYTGDIPAIEADDFILRPGQAPVKFNEGDLILGGTELDGGQGGDITNKINNVNTNTNTTTQAQTRGPIELTGTLTVKGEGENATVNVQKLLKQMSSGDLQNLSMMLSNATA
jgi:hypothetical protein|tara:strand:- start:14178 stop:16088 length:1911 start_codon:yes stop_codon:yes gene_type:complete